MGFIWLGTFSGLNRYDGRNFEVFRPESMNPASISSSVIFDILEDSADRLWIGTDGGGLNLYDYANGTFRSFSGEPGKGTGIRSQKVFCLEEDGLGRIWVGTADAGISILNPETGQFSAVDMHSTMGLKSDVIRVIKRDSFGRMWVGTQGGGLCLFQEGDRCSSFLPGTTVRAVYEDTMHRIWVGLEGEGLILLNDHSGEPEFFTVIPGQIIRSIAEDQSGRLWVGTERDGLFILEQNQNYISVVHDQDQLNSLCSDFIRDIFVDQSGLIWVATRGGGVDRYNSRSEVFSYVVQGGYAVRQIAEGSEGDLWIATDGQGVIHTDEAGHVTSYTSSQVSPAVLASNHLYALAEDSAGNLWIGSDGDGLDRLNIADSRIEHFTSDPENDNSLSSDVIWTLLYDREGNLWVGTEGGGLNLYDPVNNQFNHFRNHPNRDDSLLGNSVRTIFQDSEGDLWIGSWDGGLSRKVPGEDSFVNYTRDPRTPDSISDNSVNCIAQTEDGMLWVGTSGGGLNRLNPETGVFTSFRVSDGLADDNVFGILPDRQGYLWISTANGLSRLDIITSQFTNFWRADGLLTNEFGRNAYLRSVTGKLYFGTSRGVLEFLPGAVRMNTYKPDVYITDFSLFNQSVREGDRIRNRVYLEKNILLSSGVTVYPGDSFIGFVFVALDFSNPMKNKYAVMLEGFDSDWHYLGTENSFYYASLPPGKYTLRVMGTNSNGSWSTEYKDLAVTVLPSFFQTWYFYVLLFFGLGGIFYLGVRIRLAGLHRHNLLLHQFSNYVQDVREDERKMIARDVHDELGQLLTTLKMHIFWLSRNASSVQEQRQARYDSMLGIINTTLDWSKDLATRLRPVILDNLSLGEAIEWLLKEMEKHTQISFTHSIEATPDISPDRATAIFRIVQETITNIMRHSKATRARLSLLIQGGQISISISDNGQGIDKNSLSDSTSYGIIGMRERTKYLGGEITINSSVQGTSVYLRVPLKG